MDMLIFSILEPLTSVSLLISIRIYSAPSAQSCFKVRPSVPIGFHSFHYLFATYLQESLTISAPSKSFSVTANSSVHFVKTCFFVFCLRKNISALLYSKQAAKDSNKIELSSLKPTVKHLIEIIKNNPFENPSPYEKLVGDLAGKYSRRINIYTASFDI